MRKIKNQILKVINCKRDLLEAIITYKKESKGVIFFDTETTGLNIKYDTPFLLPWGFINKQGDTQLCLKTF